MPFIAIDCSKLRAIVMLLQTASCCMLHLGPVGPAEMIQHAVTTSADTVMTRQLHGVGHTILCDIKSCTCEAPSNSKTASSTAWG